jgi:hypothetical protein
MLSSSSSKNEATSCVDIAKSSKDALGVDTTAGNFECGVGTHCLFVAGAGSLDGIVVALLFALIPVIDFGSWEARSFASSASSP